MQKPGYGLFKTFNEVGLAVDKATSGQQLPWVSTSPITGNFYFAGKPEPPPADTKQASLTSGDAPAATTPATPQEPRFSPPDDPLRQGLVVDCDRLAAMPYDTGHTASLAGVALDKINVIAATSACNDAIQRYPDVARFVYEAGRAATARKDYPEAKRLYEQAAAASYALAMNNIGLIYEGDEGFPRNYAEAFRWCNKAVAANEPVAMINLGWMYETGHGVAKEPAEAARLYGLAARAGLPQGMNNLGLLYLSGNGVKRDYAEAQRLFERAAALGLAEAMNNLGIVYKDGDGVPRNIATARQWYEKAAALGNSAAKENLRGMRR
jgi:tetratricopeptide (TPR) repeat protein